MGEVWGQHSGTQRPGRLVSEGRAAEGGRGLLVSGDPEGSAPGWAPVRAGQGRAGQGSSVQLLLAWLGRTVHGWRGAADSDAEGQVTGYREDPRVLKSGAESVYSDARGGADGQEADPLFWPQPTAHWSGLRF